MEGISLWRICTVELTRELLPYFELYFAIHHQWLIMTRGEREEVIKGERERGKHREREIQSKEEREKPIEARIEAQSIQGNPKRVGTPHPVNLQNRQDVVWHGVA